ncbi:glycosyltransferase family 39 protein [Candidatus Daviesbacteria bacterium]|nr:glycosyltransferase family 39 protein [Candidatus Daviesbacteria bacterium]
MIAQIKTHWLILSVLALAVVLRLININQSVWLDEAINIMAVKNYDVGFLITDYSIGDLHPPLYHLLLKNWTQIFGYSEIAVRLLSVVFGTISVFLIYSLGQLIFDKKTALISAFLLAISGLHIYYSQEARMYALAAMLVLFSMTGFVQILGRFSDKLFAWVFYIVSTVLVLYADYLPYFLFATYNLYVVFNKASLGKKWLLAWCLSQAVIVLSLLPWLSVFVKQLSTGLQAAQNVPEWGQVVGAASLKALALVPLKFIIGRVTIDDKIIYTILAASVILVCSFISIRTLRDWPKTKLLWYWLVIPALLAYLVAFWIPIFTYFRFLFVLPAFILLISKGISMFPQKAQTILTVTTTAIFFVSSLFYLATPRFWRENWRDAVSYVKGAQVDRSAVVFVTDYQTAPYQYYGAPVTYYGPVGWQNRDFDQIFLMRYVQPIFDPQDKLRQNIEKADYSKVEEVDFNGVTIWRYVKVRKL